MSSINIAHTFDRIINANAELHSVKGMTCNFLKKILKCDGIPEELDDYKTKETKAPKLTKGTPSLDYLVPLGASLPGLYFQKESRGKNYVNNPVFLFAFHGKIHLPPPQNII
jgi:hypothetical protein